MTSDESAPGRDRPERARGETRSELSGAAGDVVQARDVSGGVHFHGTGATGGPVPRQLPGDVRGFINRGDDLHRLDLVLPGESESKASVICVVVGTAGVGKTSLAVHWAHQVADQFPDGALYVNLRGYDPEPPVTPERALDRFLRALDVAAGAIPVELEDRAALYRSLLANRRLLVVLDNAATVAQVRPLLPGTPGCLVLVTSRSRLSGLVARDGAHRLTMDMLPAADAVELLRSVVVDYRAADDPEELGELARLCARLPLALRIAAERAAGRPRMPLHELIADLRDESALWDALTAGGDESDAVRSVFAWSYRSLTTAARRMFRLLGLHPGAEFGVPAAAALADVTAAQARRLLDDLVGAHLVEQLTADRYQFHDLLRAYAADQARHEETPEGADAALRRVLLWYLRTAAAVVDTLFPGTRHALLAGSGDERDAAVFPDYERAIRWYETERGNLAVATRVAQDAAMYDIAWQLPVTLRRIYANSNQFDDWLATGIIGLNATRRLGERHGEATILESLGMAHTQAGNLREGVAFHQSALTVRREIGDLPGAASSTNGIGLVRLREHRLSEAMSYFEQVRAIATDLGDRVWEARALNNIANVHCELGGFQEAADLFSHVLRIYRELGEHGAEGDVLRGLSRAQRGLGNLDEARNSIDGALMIAREHENHAWEAYWLIEFGRVQAGLGQTTDALESYHRAATLQRRLGDRGREAVALDAAGEVYQELDHLGEAVNFHRFAVATHRALGDRWHLALSLDNLARALSRTEVNGEAARHRADALQALADFDDPAAEQLRRRLTSIS